MKKDMTMLNAREIMEKVDFEQVKNAVEAMYSCDKTADHCRICVDAEGAVWYQDYPKQSDAVEIMCFSKNGFDEKITADWLLHLIDENIDEVIEEIESR